MNWRPGKALGVRLQNHCGVTLPEVADRVGKLCRPIVDVSREVDQASRTFKRFESLGPRMLHSWDAGTNSLRLRKTWRLHSLDRGLQAQGVTDAAGTVVWPKT